MTFAQMVCERAVRIRNNAVLVGPCECAGCPPTCPWSIDAIWSAWREQEWVNVYEPSGVTPPPEGAERHPMCIRFVWLCVAGGVVRRAEIFGGTLPFDMQAFISGLLAELHADVVAPFLPTPGSYLFAIEFFGYRIGVPNPLPGEPRWIRTYVSRSDDYQVYRCSDPAEIGRE